MPIVHCEIWLPQVLLPNTDLILSSGTLSYCFHHLNSSICADATCCWALKCCHKRNINVTANQHRAKALLPFIQWDLLRGEITCRPGVRWCKLGSLEILYGQFGSDLQKIWKNIGHGVYQKKMNDWSHASANRKDIAKRITADICHNDRIGCRW